MALSIRNFNEILFFVFINVCGFVASSNASRCRLNADHELGVMDALLIDRTVPRIVIGEDIKQGPAKILF